MNTHYTVALAMFAGIAIGAVAMQGLHAQSKPKAYTVTEIEVIDAAAQAAYTPTIVATVGFSGGRPVNNPGGSIVGLIGEAPKRVAINEWTSLDKAQAFYNSPDWKKLAPQRDKAQKVIRIYAVENPNQASPGHRRNKRRLVPASSILSVIEPPPQPSPASG